MTHASPSNGSTPPVIDGGLYRAVMRRLAGGVVVVTAGCEDDISGMTISSLISLSASPPRTLISVNRESSSLSLIARERRLGLNILSASQDSIAARFSNRSLPGPQRFDGLLWHRGRSGLPLLTATVASLECAVEEIIERHSHALIIGTPIEADLSGELSSLAYWNRDYLGIFDDPDLSRIADVSLPSVPRLTRREAEH